MTKRRMRGLARGAALSLVLLVGLTACEFGQSYSYAGGELKPAKAAPPLDLSDQHDQPFHLADHGGKVLLIYFGYTTCPDLCPTTLADFQAVKASLGDDADKVEFILVTVDPERDTASRLSEYLAFFDPAFIGLRGDDAQTTAAKQGWGVYAQKVEQPGSATGYLVDHTSQIYVIDTEGRLRLTYPHGTSPDDITKDVEHLLDD